MHTILDTNGHVIPEKVESDVHTAYQLIRRNVGTFAEWIAKPEDAEKRLSEILAEEKARAEKAKAPKFDKDRFTEWAKNAPDYLDFAKKVREAKEKGDADALKGLLATKDELYAKLKKSYMETLKAA